MRASRLLLTLYFLSGAAALAWEVAWSRLFTLQLGSSVFVLSALLASYLGGLAVGGALGGRWAGRHGRPLRRFALLELGTLLLAWPVSSALSALDPWFRDLYAAGLTGAGPRPDAGAFLLPAAASAALLVLPAAIAMGATLPILTAGTAGRPDSAGATAGRLYAANTLGAVAGTLITGLVLLPRSGLSATMAAAATVNALVGVTAWLLDRRVGRECADPPPSRKATDGGVTLLPIAVGLASAGSMVAQLGWSRALALSLGSSTYGFTVTLAAFLTGLALGGAAGARLSRRVALPARALALLQAAAGVASIAALSALGRLPLWILPPLAGAGASQGQVLLIQGLAAGGIVVLPTFLLGATFPVAVRLRAEAGAGAGRATGTIYAAGSAGLVAGGLVSGAILFPALGLRTGLLGAGLALPVAAMISSRCGAVRDRGAATRLAVGAGGVAILAALVLPAWDPAIVTSGPFLYAPLYRESAAQDLRAWIRSRGELVDLREGAAATVSVRRASGGTLSLQINGKTDASTGGDMVTQLLAGHLPMLLAPPEASSALLIGLASGVSLGAMERYPLRHIDCVELLPEVVATAPWFDEANGRALDDPRLRLIVGDGRTHLRHGTDAYDVITSQPTNPWVAGTAALYTREAFTSAREALDEGGVFSQWVQGYALLPEDLRSVVATFLEVFPDAMLWEESPAGGDYFLVGRRRSGPARVNLALLQERMRQPQVRADLVRAGIRDEADLLTHFVAGPEALAAYAAGAPLQVDDRLALEFTAPQALYRDTLPEQVRALRRFRESPLAAVDAADLPPEFLARLRTFRAEARRIERLVLSVRSGSPANLPPDLQVGLELLQAGLRGPAEIHLRAAVEERPDLPEARALLGAVLLGMGRSDEALPELQAAVRLAPGDIASRALLARLQILRGDASAARSQVEEALRTAPDDADLNSLAGAAALLEGDAPRAAAALARAVALDPDLAEAWTNLGVARRRTGDLEGARVAYERALTLDPGDPDARFNLAVLRHLAGEDATAERLLADLVRDDPLDVAARRERARALVALGRPEDARAELLRVITIDPESEQAADARAALAALGREAR